MGAIFVACGQGPRSGLSHRAGLVTPGWLHDCFAWHLITPFGRQLASCLGKPCRCPIDKPLSPEVFRRIGGTPLEAGYSSFSTPSHPTPLEVTAQRGFFKCAGVACFSPSSAVSTWPAFVLHWHASELSLGERHRGSPPNIPRWAWTVTADACCPNRARQRLPAQNWRSAWRGRSPVTLLFTGQLQPILQWGVGYRV